MLKESGVAGAERIKSRQDFQQFLVSYKNLISQFPGFVSLQPSGSYNSDLAKKDFGDIDLIVHVASEQDKATVKKELQAFMIRQPETVIVPFSSEKHAGKRAYNAGELVSVRYHDDTLGYSAQIDNIIALDHSEASFKQSFLDMPAEKQGLVLGLVKIATIETAPSILFQKLGIRAEPTLGPDQEYEFNLSSVELQLRKATYKPGTYEQLKREIIWTSRNYDDLQKLLYQYDLNTNFDSLLAQSKKNIKNPRSNNRMQGVFSSMISVKSGEVGTAKGAGKEAALAKVQQTFRESRMSIFRALMENTNKKVVFAFGRFQPPTIGHELLINTVKETAAKTGSDYVIYVSKTQDAKTNPLDIGTKMAYLQKMFPGTNFVAADETIRTPIEAIKSLNQQYKELTWIAGSDRLPTFSKLANDYNGKEYQYQNLQVITSGDRDPDSEGTEGMSGTKMREAAVAGNFEVFRQGLPASLSEKDAMNLMNLIRQGLVKPAKVKKGVAEARQSNAAKLQNAWEREQEKSAASAKRGREYMDKLKAAEPKKKEEPKKDQGVAEGLTDDPRFQKAMKKIADTTPRVVVQYPADLIPPNVSPDERERLSTPVRRPSEKVFRKMLDVFLAMRRDGIDTEEALDRIREDLEQSDYEWTDDEIASILGDLNVNDIPDVDYDDDMAEAVDIGQEWMSDTELDQYVPERLQQQWRELLGYDENGNPSALWANLTGGYEPDVNDPQHRRLMVKVANKWFAAKKIPNVKFFDVKDADDELEWLVQIGQQGVAEGWKDESSEHDEFLAHARQQLQNATPVERIRLAQRLTKLEQKHFPEMSSIESNGISSSITGMLHSITDANPRPNQQFGNVTTPQGSGSTDPLRPDPIHNKPSGATTSFAEPDNDEFDNQGSDSFNDFVDWYQSASAEEQSELQQDIANTENMSPEEAKEYIDYIINNGKIDPEEWKEMKATELGEKITAVSGTAPAGYNNKPTTTSSKKPVGAGVTGGTVYTGSSSQQPARSASELDRVRAKMGKDVAEGKSNIVADTAKRLSNTDDGKIAKLRAAGDKRREEHLKSRDISKKNEAMLPRSAFAGSDKNKLGSAGQWKNTGPSKNRAARAGDLVGGCEESVEQEHIVKVKGGYELKSKHGNKNLGKYPTKAGAEKRERQVQYFKHAGEGVDKKKGADGKACWDGYRYNGTENGKDKCVKVSEGVENIMGTLIDKIIANEAIQNIKRRS